MYYAEGASDEPERLDFATLRDLEESTGIGY